MSDHNIPAIEAQIKEDLKGIVANVELVIHNESMQYSVPVDFINLSNNFKRLIVKDYINTYLKEYYA